MNPLTLEAPMQPTASERKRLGQYFTGIRLAHLLATLAEARQATSIIDPMAGTGDMLEASLLAGARPNILGAIDIDPAAHYTCQSRFAGKEINKTAFILGSAFNPSTLKTLPTLSWDLVITNPPYVRYQSLAKTSSLSDIEIPDSSQVRKGVLAAIDLVPNLELKDKGHFKTLARNYSGFADLAVPSWLLSAALVKPGGTLAMVVPESWLSRDYAAVIQYLLLRWFKIVYIVEDANAAWFPSALVKTTLLIAQRIPGHNSAFKQPAGTFHRISLPSTAINAKSIVGRLFPDSANPESSFALHLKQVAAQKSKSKLPISTQSTSFQSVAENVERKMRHHSWLKELDEPAIASNQAAIHIPSEISALLGNLASHKLTTLESFGAQIGQGLRTGANFFFYADALKNTQKTQIVATSKIFGFTEVTLPKECALPVLRKQAELPENFIIDAATLCGRVLTFHNHALPEDIRGSNASTHYSSLPESAAAYLRCAARTKTSDGKLIPTLSAVAPNIRSSNSLKENRLQRFWYMLPAFTARHYPDLLIPRVNGEAVKAFINKDRRALIDANFSTIWFKAPTAKNSYAALALLNSSWTVTILELSGAVLGGGALKVEASHLKKLPIPNFSNEAWGKLSQLGSRLMRTPNSVATKTAIDLMILGALVGRRTAAAKHAELLKLCRSQLIKRLGK